MEQAGYPIYEAAWNAAHEKMESSLVESLPDDELEKIDFTHNQDVIHWEDDGTDLFFNNTEYDIVKTKIVKDTVYYYCIKEKKEEGLMEKICQNTWIRTNNKITIVNPTLLSKYIVSYREATQSKTFFPAGNFSIAIPGSVTGREKDIIPPPPKG